MEKANIGVFIILISLFIPIPMSSGQVGLIMDAVISDGEWDDSYSKTIRMNHGEDIELKTQYTETDVYFLVTFSHKAPGDVINRDPTSGKHDYFGIEFDRNNDATIMGIATSPDDMVLIDYIEPGAVDMFSHTFTVFEDAKNGGSNDVEGMSNNVTGTLIYEFRKSLKSSDTEGYDISLKTGDTFYIMPAIWDDKPIHETTSRVNLEIANRLFIEMTVGEPADKTNQEIFVFGVIILSSGAFVLLIYLKSRYTSN